MSMIEKPKYRSGLRVDPFELVKKAHYCFAAQNAQVSMIEKPKYRSGLRVNPFELVKNVHYCFVAQNAQMSIIEKPKVSEWAFNLLFVASLK